MTSLSDGLGPQKHPNSGRTRVESGPAGPHRPTTRRGSAIAQPSVPRAQAGDVDVLIRAEMGPWVSHGRAAPGALRACVILSDSTPANAVNFSARASAEYVCVATYGARSAKRIEQLRGSERKDVRAGDEPALVC